MYALRQSMTTWVSSWFISSSYRWSDRRNLPYLLASLSIVFWQAIQAFSYGTSRTYMVQDDARQHVFWMQRWFDSDLFPNDLIADYFQSVAPFGYQWIYRLFGWLGIEPLQAAKILPGIIAAIATFLLFRLSLKLIPIPWIAFLSCLFLNQALWL